MFSLELRKINKNEILSQPEDMPDANIESLSSVLGFYNGYS
jgi:hypothetical protein